MGLLGRFRITPAFVLALAAVVIAVGGVAIGSVPGSNGLITACYSKHGGKMRIVDTSKRRKAGHCGGKERKLTWNQQGLKGDQGVAGTPGTPGTPGASGVHNATVRYADFTSDLSGFSSHEHVECHPGEVAIGGGIGWTQSPGSGDAVMYSGPETTTSDPFPAQGGTPVGWDGEIRTSDTGINKTGRVYAICAAP
jgi:hypothetical protein